MAMQTIPYVSFGGFDTKVRTDDANADRLKAASDRNKAIRDRMHGGQGVGPQAGDGNGNDD